MFFEKSLTLTSAAFIWSKYSENSKTVKYNHSLKYLFSMLISFEIKFIPVMAKLNFQHNFSGL